MYTKRKRPGETKRVRVFSDGTREQNGRNKHTRREARKPETVGGLVGSQMTRWDVRGKYGKQNVKTPLRRVNKKIIDR